MCVMSCGCGVGSYEAYAPEPIVLDTRRKGRFWGSGAAWDCVAQLVCMHISRHGCFTYSWRPAHVCECRLKRCRRERSTMLMDFLKRDVRRDEHASTLRLARLGPPFTRRTRTGTL